ncbi:MAG TPA: VOC family protein [Firmicutes bacterium]|jgi:lactoylglutathione lyase|nr:VOC family protein [Bacillota bacterium]
MNKLLHVRVRVSDLERSIAWYKEYLGFELERRTERSPAGNQLAFVRLPGSEVPIEFCYSPDYELAVPEDLMHFAIGVPDLTAVCAELEAKGLEIWPENWREAFAAGRKMAFIIDPDDYEIELLELKSNKI